MCPNKPIPISNPFHDSQRGTREPIWHLLFNGYPNKTVSVTGNCMVVLFPAPPSEPGVAAPPSASIDTACTHSSNVDLFILIVYFASVHISLGFSNRSKETPHFAFPVRTSCQNRVQTSCRTTINMFCGLEGSIFG